LIWVIDLKDLVENSDVMLYLISSLGFGCRLFCLAFVHLIF